MGILTNITKSLSVTAGRTGLKIVKYSPELLQIAGGISFIGAIASAIYVTGTRAEDILENHRRKMEEAEEAVEIAEEDGVDYNIGREKTIVYAETVWDFTKAYVPTIALSAISIGCFLSANKILKTRYLGAVAAFNAVSEAFKGYRGRIIDEYGEEADRYAMYGERKDKIEVTEMNENGKVKKHKEEVMSSIPPWYSAYAKVFDASCADWNKNPTFSMIFLKAQQEIANNLLHTRGHVFLNEVYEMLGFEHTSVGAVVGWVDGGFGDSFIDFGLYDTQSEATRRFVNGLENVIILDFNVDGVIYDKI